MATKTTTLEAVNIILSNIGQAPTTSLDSTNPQVNLAELILEQVSSDVQSEGWVFNTEKDYPFHPDADTGEIEVPTNVLQIDQPWGTRYSVVVRQNKLYDKIGHTYKWNEVQRLDVIWLFDFDDLPEAAKLYISTRAANLFAMRATGSTEVARYSEREEANARAALLEYETQQGDYSIFSAGLDESPRRTYRPVDAIWRY